MERRQKGLFDFEDRMREIGENDPLAKLDAVIDWEVFRETIEHAVIPEARGPGGRPRFDVIQMFKILVLQRVYHLSDGRTEFMIRDRLSFMRFVGVDLHQTVPDEKTIWRFREELIRANVMNELWRVFNVELRRMGIQTSRGKIIDASIVETNRPKRNRSRNRGVTETRDGRSAGEHTLSQERQMDRDARWTVKRNRPYFGYKNHIKIDAKTKLIEESAVTDASVHDSRMMRVLLTIRDRHSEVYADKGYAGMGCLTAVIERRVQSRIIQKAYRNTPISAQQKAANRSWSRIRARVEHVFGDQRTGMHLTRIRTRGLPRAEFTLQLTNLAYNLRRLRFLLGGT